MKAFEELGRRVALAWRRAGGDLPAFTGIAVRALEAFPYALTQPGLDAALARRLLSSAPLPDQVNLHNSFGQPPVTLYNDGRCVVDLYFWLTFDTSIHSHGFRGAFRVLHGTSLHEEFRVWTSRALAPDLHRVRLGAPRASLLNAGDVRPIHPGLGLTHRVIHLENPTVTLCVKTINEPRLVQWKYFPGGLAVRMRRLEPGLLKKIYYFQYLLSRDAQQASSFLDLLLRRLDPSTCLNLQGAVADGAIGLTESAALHVEAQIRGLHGRAAWFRRLEEVDPDALRFEEVDTPRGRLLAHLINGGHDAKTVRSLLGSPSRPELEAAVADLVDVDGLFGLDLSLADRAAIKALLARPSRPIPAALRACGQLRRLRSFLLRFRD